MVRAWEILFLQVSGDCGTGHEQPGESDQTPLWRPTQFYSEPFSWYDATKRLRRVQHKQFDLRLLLVPLRARRLPVCRELRPEPANTHAENHRRLPGCRCLGMKKP